LAAIDAHPRALPVKHRSPFQALYREL